MKLKFTIFLFIFYSCREIKTSHDTSEIPIAVQLSKAQSSDGQFISWEEHIIDDVQNGVSDLAGSDGLKYNDLDGDGIKDVVSVHELDVTYDEKGQGYIRIAFGSKDPHKWESMTLASKEEAAGAEDISIADINGDGFKDIVAACEQAHLIYFENPGSNIRDPNNWKRHIPTITQNRGSFIRVFTADLDNDGKAEIITANKGDQLAQGQFDDQVKIEKPISYFKINGDPLKDDAWEEYILLETRIPINSRPVDIDGDDDLDIIAGSRGDCKLYILENTSIEPLTFKSIEVQLKLNDNSIGYSGSLCATGFNMDFTDINEDGKTDIILNVGQIRDDNILAWLEQPKDIQKPWIVHPIGFYTPDELVGLKLADINGDGLDDIMTGGYSRGERASENETEVNSPLGRLAWFEQTENPDMWIRHDFSRRKRGMFDLFVPTDLDDDGDIDFITTRGNSFPFDGVIWLKQVRTVEPIPNFTSARKKESEEMPLLSN